MYGVGLGAVLLCLATVGVDAVHWVLLKEGDLEAGLNDPVYPTKRYGAAMWSKGGDEGGVVVASGYMYDTEHMQPLWLRGDWWQFDPSSGGGHWSQRRVTGLGDEDARYKAAATRVAGVSSWRSGGDRLLLFGGGQLDGKTVRNDLSIVDFDGAMQAVAQRGTGPFGRHSASMLSLGLDGAVLLYGGMGGRGELDAAVYVGQIEGTGVLDVSCLWTRFSDDAASSTPLPRRAATLVSYQQHHAASDPVEVSDSAVAAFLLFGGFSENPRNFNDVWQLRVWLHPNATTMRLVWSCLHDGAVLAPPARGASVGASFNGTLFIALGASCDLMGCRTHSDVWRFDVAMQSWRQINLPAAASPVGRQFAAFATTLSTQQPSLVVFGGESFHPHAYWNDVWALRLGEEDADGATTPPVSWHTAHSTRNQGSLMPAIREPLPRPHFKSQGSDLVPLAALLAFLCYIVAVRSGRIAREWFSKGRDRRRGRRGV